MRQCPCGKPIKSKYSLCPACVNIYGNDRKEWPEWLLFLVNDIQRELKQENDLYDREIVFSDMDPDNIFEE